MSATDELLERAAAYAAAFEGGALGAPPARHVAIVTCMDARVNPYGIFGLTEGDAHVVRNAGGAATDDVVRSLAVSQRLLGTTEVILVHHADCGMRTVSDEAFRRALHAETGVRPAWAVEPFSDPAADVRRALGRIRSSPFLPHTGSVRGFVYDDRTGTLSEVT